MAKIIASEFFENGFIVKNVTKQNIEIFKCSKVHLADIRQFSNKNKNLISILSVYTESHARSHIHWPLILAPTHRIEC